jgi:non-heme chloroperoxidase
MRSINAKDGTSIFYKDWGSGKPVVLKVFDDIRSGVLNDRSRFYRDLAVPFYGYNKPDAKPSQGGSEAQYDCIKAFSETDFTRDLKEIDIPVLVMHGDADQIVPIDDSAKNSAKLLRKSTPGLHQELMG